MDEPDRRERALRALSLSRRHRQPLSQTAAKVRLSAEEILEETGGAWVQQGNDWWATKRDRLRREIEVLTDEGPEWIVTYDSQLASRLSQQDSAVGHYLDMGDPSRLRRMTLGIGSRTVRLASDPQTIDRLAAGGEIHLEFYRR